MLRPAGATLLLGRRPANWKARRASAWRLVAAVLKRQNRRAARKYDGYGVAGEESGGEGEGRCMGCAVGTNQHLQI
jgi:hypothetical protein